MMYGFGSYGGLGMGGFFGGLVWLVVTVVFWALIISLIVWVVRELTGHHSRGRFHFHSSALDILEERFAKGEIDKAEFEEKKRALLS